MHCIELYTITDCHSDLLVRAEGLEGNIMSSNLLLLLYPYTFRNVGEFKKKKTLPASSGKTKSLLWYSIENKIDKLVFPKSRSNASEQVPEGSAGSSDSETGCFPRTQAVAWNIAPYWKDTGAWSPRNQLEVCAAAGSCAIPSGPQAANGAGGISDVPEDGFWKTFQ